MLLDLDNFFLQVFEMVLCVQGQTFSRVEEGHCVASQGSYFHVFSSAKNSARIKQAAF